MSRHHWFEVTTPHGVDIRIRGDSQMAPETLAALMRAADLLAAQLAPKAPTEFRADGWPLCPHCGEDELWSHLQWPSTDWPDLDKRPPMEAYLAAGLSCYRCGWSSDQGAKGIGG